MDAEPVGIEVRRNLHGNSKAGKYAINYKLTAAMQQMGNGVLQMEIICGFRDLPCSTSIRSHIERAEEVLGKVEIEMMNRSCAEAIEEEIEATKKVDGDKFKLHACTMEGHEHIGLPVLTTTYGS